MEKTEQQDINPDHIINSLKSQVGYMAGQIAEREAVIEILGRKLRELENPK